MRGFVLGLAAGVAVGLLLYVFWRLRDPRRRPAKGGVEPATPAALKPAMPRQVEPIDPGLNLADFKPGGRLHVPSPASPRHESIGSIVLIHYRDKSGTVTQRRIRVLSVSSDRLTAFCLMRRAKRTFLFSGIIGQAIDESTGELLWPDEL